jgi:DNA repair protein RadC
MGSSKTPAERPISMVTATACAPRFRDGAAPRWPIMKLLELALFRALPRRDTKPIAKALLKQFGTIAEILGAPAARLKRSTASVTQLWWELKLLKAFAERNCRRRGCASGLF